MQIHIQLKERENSLTSFSPPLTLASESSPPESSVGEPPSSFSTTKSESYMNASILYRVGHEYQKVYIKNYTHTHKFTQTQ